MKVNYGNKGGLIMNIKKGNLDKSVKICSEIKKKNLKKRMLKEPKNQIEKLRNEIWFPNKDIIMRIILKVLLINKRH